ncbi:MAG: VCBS repeat-containing protein [Acidobacteriota bacterium]|nr:MAG: VCBS repeat-containing protein [Acidobacteriota bacterium]
MKLRSKLVGMTILIALTVAVYVLFPSLAEAQTNDPVTEILYRNNRGVALLDQYKFKEAASQFQGILDLDSKVLPAIVNLGIAYFYDQQYEAAETALQNALKIEPNEIHSHYLLGLIYRNQDEVESAIRSFEAVSRQDPVDPSTNYYLGRLYMRQRDYETAGKFFKMVIDQEPYNASAHYNLATALSRSGKREEGRAEMDEFRRLQSLFGSTTVGLQYLEQGRYAIAIDNVADKYLPGKPRQEATAITVKFTETAAESGLAFKHAGPGTSDMKAADWNQVGSKIAPFVGSGIAAGDFDQDGWMDLYLSNAGPGGAQGALFRNQGDGTFENVTAKSGLTYKGQTMQAFWGDYNNDFYPDLYLVNYGPNALFQNQKDGTFKNVSAETGTGSADWGIGGSFVDYDHDGDLDIYVANFSKASGSGDPGTIPGQLPGARNVVYRNNGDGTFTDVSVESKLDGGDMRTSAIIAADFDNTRDIDFLLVNQGGTNQLLTNLRDGTFRSASDLAFAKNANGVGVGAGDINRDGLIDIAIASLQSGGSDLYLNRGLSRFEPIGAGLKSLLNDSAQSIQMFDFDNDGDLDVLALTSSLFASTQPLNRGQNLRLLENQGSKFVDVSTKTGIASIAAKPIRGVTTTDYDNDGDLDLAINVNGAAPLLLRNDGGNQNNWISVKLVGSNSNKSGIGVKAEVKVGNLWQKKETFGGHGFLMDSPPVLHFGLGKNKQADVVRLVWPNGVLQSEIDTPANQAVEIQELDRKGTSCPIMYVWDGSNYRFQTDFLGGSAYGSLLAPGIYNYPDTNEYIKLNRTEVALKDGDLAITLNNQLEEVILFDELKLVAVDHPAEYDIYPDEKLLPGPPYQDFRILTANSAVPPQTAVDDRGRDILPAISQIDRSYPEVRNPYPFKGYSDLHSITLDLGQVSDEYAVLLMHAWIDYADSSSNLAASQAQVKLVPPYLQVEDEHGNWVTVIERMGFPAGLPKTMTVDLSGRFLSESRKVRIVTSMKIFWDQILVASGSARSDFVTHRMEAKSADLRYKGFPKFDNPDGKLPKMYFYDEPSRAEWKVHVGAYTKFGEVAPLLTSQDDMFVITRSGDEIEAKFDVGSLPALPEGWVRDYLIYVDGFGKDMDPNSAAPQFLGPLPFHGMSAFPYPAGESYPLSEKHRKYLEEWNTRVYEQAVPEISKVRAEE